jgi:hypothetical protein
MTTDLSYDTKSSVSVADLESAKIAKKSTGKRKFHKKSRKGCATCKRRRVKCDEARPICGNCERMAIQCVYLIPESTTSNPTNEIMSTPYEPLNIKQEPLTKPRISKKQQQVQNQQYSQQYPQQYSQHSASTQQHLHHHQKQQQQQQQGTKSYVQQPKHATLQPSSSLQQPETPKDFTPVTPMMMNSSLANPLSPISQFLQQLPQSPIPTAAAQIGAQFLNNFPPEMQMKLFQQFQQLPPDKQQQLYQSLPMTVKASSESLNLDENIIDNLDKPPSNDLISDLINEFVPNKTNFMKNSNSGKTPTPQELAAQYQQRSQASKDLPITNDPQGPSLSPDSIRSTISPLTNNQSNSSGKISDLNMLDLRLMYHYTAKVWPTITAAGISDSKIWSDDIPMLAFKYPFLMHSVLAFSATHLSRNERGLDQCVTCHRAEALRLLREAVLEMSPENTDALVAAALILIMDSLANASLPTSSSIKSLPPSAWIFHVKGAATILTAVWPLSEKSRFYKFISVDLGDLGEIGYDLISGELANTSDSNENSRSNSISTDKNDLENDIRFKENPKTSPDLTTLANMAARSYGKSKKPRYSSIPCFDDEISDMFPIALNSPYFPTLAYMAKLHNERNKSDFILRIFAFPALLDKRFLGLLINCDLSAMRIMRCYYRLLRNFTEEMKEKVWFLEGVSTVLPADVEQYAGGGGMHMMLDFLGGPSTIDDDGNGENYVAKSAVQSGLLDTNNLPSASITDSLGLDDNSGLNNDNDN